MLSLQVKEKNFMMWFSTFLCEIKAEKFSYMEFKRNYSGPMLTGIVRILSHAAKALI